MSISREKFVRLAESRTNRLIKDLDLLGNLSNRTNYTYSDEDIRKIFSTLSKKMSGVRQKFENSLKAGKKETFTL